MKTMTTDTANTSAAACTALTVPAAAPSTLLVELTAPAPAPAQKQPSALPQFNAAQLLTKSGQKDIAEAIIGHVLSGEGYAPQTAALVRGLAAVAERVMKDPDLIAAVAEECGGKPVKLGSVRVSVAETARLDYTQCGWPRYNELAEERAAIAEEMKGMEDKMRKLKHAVPAEDSETGEKFTMTPPARTVGQCIRAAFPE